MSLVQAIRGETPVEASTPEAIGAASARVCAELLGRNRLPPHAVIAARFRTTGGLPVEPAVEAARQAGWQGIPIFGETARDGRPALEVEAHVRLKRKRRLKPVNLGSTS